MLVVVCGSRDHDENQPMSIQVTPGILRLLCGTLAVLHISCCRIFRFAACTPCLRAGC